MAEPLHRLPSLNGLRAFEVAARHLNFRIAAEELGVTQGAVAQQVRGLEAELGIRLFDRLPRTLALTEAGRAYAIHIRRAFDLVAEATATIRPEPLHLTISVTPSFASKWLIPRLPDFLAAHPELDMRILASERISNFQSDAVDIAVRLGHPPFGAGLVADLLFEQELVAVCSPALLAGRQALTSADLARFVLLHDTHNQWPEFVEKLDGGAPAAASKSVRFNHTSHAIEAAIAGQGMALASSIFVREDIAAGRLVQAFSETMRATSDFYVVSPRRPQHAQPVANVRDWLLRHASIGVDGSEAQMTAQTVLSSR
ncbi:LysR family transcriptional regulator [Rhizobium sp. AC44/96]|uniref:transcriptional regulator GcvA n=1 Tax=unclassified Rhizobium TaxID=2613769 RepID=UPI00080FEC9B|nr:MULTISPECIES: transcriptional regulator GcvA [unclassified Rhizobium]MDM9620407.1 transcriptional regulator GcvA [Rhizobium sp. S96]OCJ09105.1 LysR family transcriptional regulator [Rhizobium sp. AC44/96]